MQTAATPAYDPRLRNLANRKICTNLFLQQLLYYNVIFDIGYLVFWFAWLVDQYWVGLTFKDGDIVRTVMFIFWFLAEPTRLAAGFYGNLHENVPWLLMFCVLTLAPTHASCYYIMLASGRRTALTKSVQVCQAIFLELGFIAGLVAMRRMYVLQKQQYYLFEFAMNQRARARREIEQTGTAS